MVFFVISTIALSSTLVFLILNKQKKYLNPELAKKSCSKIQKTSTLDTNHSLIESHKILVSTIQQMYDGKKLSASELLNKVAKRFPDEKEIWKFHRMRNKAAHEVDFQISDEEATAARKAFKAALKALST